MDHVTDAHTPHSHGHDHGHSHDHGHDHSHGGSDYYLQQLLTVFICGAFGVSGVLMYTLGKLDFILAPAFHIWVLVGSGLLLAAVAFRMVALWRSAGAHAHDHHDHDHAHADADDCGHDHKPGEKCDHDHGHSHADHSAEDHEHGNIYWRVVVLAFPVAILAMGLPNSSFSAERERQMLGQAKEIDVPEDVKVKDGEIKSDFDLLASAAYSQQKRDAYTGAKASIVGKMRKITDKQFTLYKLKITCCSSDAIPLQALAIVKSASQMAGFNDGEEVEVKGVIQFAPNDKGEYITVLKVDPDGIRRTGK